MMKNIVKGLKDPAMTNFVEQVESMGAFKKCFTRISETRDMQSFANE
jgi:hypothetical protein